MAQKTRIVSGVLLGILTVPMVIGQIIPQGDVLGVSEQANSVPTSTDGDIAGGVMESSNTSSSSNTNSSSSQNKLSGKIVLREGLQVKAASDKIDLARGITVTQEGQNVNLVVEKADVELPEDTVLAVNKETFKKLGGNPQEETSIQATTTINNQ